MRSKNLDIMFIALTGLLLLARLFIECSLKTFGALGAVKIGNLLISVAAFVLVSMYFLKKTIFKEKIIVPKGWIVLALFGIICTLSIFYSIDAPSSLSSAIYLWSCIFLIVMLVNLLDSIKRIKVIFLFFIAVGLIASVEAIGEYFFQLPWYLAHANPQMLEGHRDVAQLVQTHRTPTLFMWPNTFCGFLIMVLPLAAALGLGTQKLSTKLRMGVLCVIFLYALFIELSISCWLSLFLATLIFSFYLMQDMKVTQLKSWVMMTVSALGLILTVVVIKKFNFSHMNSFSSRMQFLNHAYYLIKNHPFIGNGWDSFGTASAAYAKDINGWTNYAHNSYVQIFSELGLYGIVNFTLFLVCLWKAARLILTPKYHEHRWLILGLLIAISSCLIDNCFSYTMLKASTAFYWWVLVAVLFSLKEFFEPLTGSLILSFRLKLVLVATVIFLSSFSYTLMAAEYDYFIALPDIHSNINQQEALRLFQEGGRLNPWDKKFELAQAVVYEEMFYQTRDKSFLNKAHEMALMTMGQASLGAERQAVLDRVDANEKS